MVARPFLSDADVAGIARVRLDGFATRLALAGGGTWVTFARWNAGTESWGARPAQRVLLTVANRQEQEAASEAARTTTTGGTMEKEEPFDVETGDYFTLVDPRQPGQELAGRIVAVLPPRFGTQVATWELRQGEA